MTQSKTKKLPRFTRARIDKPGLKLQPRDIEIIKLVHDHRFLDSSQIRALTEGSERVIRRLQKLFHHGYLDRPREQVSYAVGTRRLVYALANRGADILATEHGIDRGKINWRTKNDEAKIRYIDHGMMISNFRVALTLALKAKPKTGLAFWKQGIASELRDQITFRDTAGSQTRIPINPDAFFCLQDPEHETYFFLEADRSTMTNHRFLKKMRGYWHYWEQKGHAKKHNIKAFRVLTITKSQQRADNLRSITKLADTRQRGSLMFWFTPETAYNLENPSTILNPIWQTPVDDTHHAILE